MAALFSSLATRRGGVSPSLMLWFIMVPLSLAAAIGAIALAGTKTGLILALMAVLGPIALYLAVVSPIVFPFCVFVLLVPFDNLLAVSSFGTGTKAMAILSGAAFVVWLLRTRRFAVPGRTLAAWAALHVWMVVSLVWAIDPQSGIDRLATPLELFSLYAAASLLPIDGRTLRLVLGVAIAGAIVASLYGTYIFHSGTDVSTNGRLFLSNDSTLIDPNHFAAALIVPLTLALSALAAASTVRTRIVAAGTVGILALGISIAGSRGALLAIAAAFIYLIVRSQRKVLMTGVGIAGLGLALATHGNVLQRFSTAASSGGAGRSDIWKVGFAAFKEHWLVGAGFGNFPVAFDQSFLSISEAYYTHWHRVSHNILVGYSVELGVIGTILLVAAWWYQFRALRDVPQGHPMYSVRVGLESGLIGLFVAGFFLDIMTEKYVWLAFILVMLARNAARASITTHVQIPQAAHAPAWRPS